MREFEEKNSNIILTVLLYDVFMIRTRKLSILIEIAGLHEGIGYYIVNATCYE